MAEPLKLDVLIFGGGAAGLWLLDTLMRRGYGTLLLEAHELGRGQTIASQGIIHGGLKYSLRGLLTPSAKAIAEMPGIWRKCLAGQTHPDLSKTILRADFCHLWQTTSMKSRLAMIGARAGLRVAPVTLDDHDRPEALTECPGVVARLDEQVIEPASLLADLAAQHRSRILKYDSLSGLDVLTNESAGVDSVSVRIREPHFSTALRPRMIVLTAGEGNADLRARFGLQSTLMQRRPLHMVMARGELPVLNAHCVDGSATRVTITSTQDSQQRAVWQIGGQLSEAGVSMSAGALIQHTKGELEAVLPGVDFSRLEWATYRVDRAEAVTRGGMRPENVFVKLKGNIITAWPTKLALAPEMARQVLALVQGTIAKPQAKDAQMAISSEWPKASVAAPPWETATWFTGH